jgi:cell division protein FtsB
MLEKTQRKKSKSKSKLLEEKIQKLEAENASLKNSIKMLKIKINNLKKK